MQGPPRFLDPFQAGLYLIPTSASMVAVAPLSGWLSDRYGSTPFLVAGLAVSAAGFFWLATIPPTASIWQLTPHLVLVGAGMGLFASPNRAAMMTAAPDRRRGIASGMGTTLTNTGATVSLGLTLALMASVMPQSMIVAILLGTASSGSAADGVPRRDPSHLPRLR
ncbi:major facilitator superfamily MFS_1, partial [mine drainage metagenome]